MIFSALVGANLRINFPKKHGAIITAANKGFPIRTERDASNPITMTRQCFLMLTCVRIP